MPRKGVRVRRRRALQQIAAQQHGLFTVSQAASVDLDRRARYHHLSYGNWRRTEAPDVLRLVGWPPDPLERVRAWLLWAGPGAVVTSWTALGLRGVIGWGPRAPIELEVPDPRTRAERRRTATRRRQLASVASRDGRVTVLPSPVWHRAPVQLLPLAPGADDTYADMAVRSITDALCVAVRVERRASLLLAMLEPLLDSGAFTLSELMRSISVIGGTPLYEWVLLRRRSLAGAASGRPA